MSLDADEMGEMSWCAPLLLIGIEQTYIEFCTVISITHYVHPFGGLKA